MFLIPIYTRCIPYMLIKEEDAEEKSCQQDVLGRLQVLMISTPKRSDLIFPKVRQQDQMAIPYAPCFNRSIM